MNESTVNRCYICRELAGFYCNGCNSIFCQHHADEHQQSLYEQLDWLTGDHDDFLHKLNDQISIKKTYQPSKAIIDQWEEDSIQHIRKIANEARKALNTAIETRINSVKEQLKSLTEKLQEITNDHNDSSDKKDNFDERNIKQWATELHNIKHDFFTQPSFTVRIHANKPVVMPIIRIQPDTIDENHSNEQSQQQQYSLGLIPLSSFDQIEQRKRSLSNNSTTSLKKDDRFSICSDHIKILDDGQLFIHDSSKLDACIGGYHEYYQGVHKLYFHIENMTSNEWLFFGIISKRLFIGQQAHLDSSAYGWAGYNQVYMNGRVMHTLNGYLDNMKINDFIELTIDCDTQTLYLWHSRQTYKNKLPVDIRTCPFPWQFLVSCHNKNDAVRILPPSMGPAIKREQDKLSNTMKMKEIQLKNENQCFPIS